MVPSVHSPEKPARLWTLHQFLTVSGAARGAPGHQAALLQLGYHRHVFEVRGTAVERLQQLERLLPLRAVEQLHLIGQTLSLVDGLETRGGRL